MEAVCADCPNPWAKELKPSQGQTAGNERGESPLHARQTPSRTSKAAIGEPSALVISLFKSQNINLSGLATNQKQYARPAALRTLLTKLFVRTRRNLRDILLDAVKRDKLT